MQSGTAISFGNRFASTAATSWYNLTSEIGCGTNATTSAEDVMECMRRPNTTWQTIEAATGSAAGLASLIGNFGPTIDNRTVYENYTERALAGQYAKLPTLVGNNNYEAGLFIFIAAGAGQTLTQSQWDAFDQEIFIGPTSTAAQYRADQGVPTWRYYYSGMFPNLLIPTVNISQAYHSSEITVLFGTTQEASRTDSIWQERALGDYMRGAWSAFAADPVHGLGELYGWPNYQVNDTSLVMLGQNNETVAAFGKAGTVDTNCTYPTLGFPNF